MANEIKLYENNGALAKVEGDNYVVSIPNGSNVTLNRSHKDKEGKDLGDGDFGVIPHTSKPSLFKSGADKIRIAYGFFERHTPVNELCVVDIENGFIRYVDKCELVKLNPQTGQEYVFASYVASANNWESRNGKAAKTMGVDNNTVKIAEKRSMVSAVISVANLSNLFTMDIEDEKLEKAFSEIVKNMDDEKISGAQVKFLWTTVSSAKKYTKDEFKKALMDIGYNSTSEITKSKLGDVLEIAQGNMTAEEFKEKHK
jgi:hypothetical protein